MGIFLETDRLVLRQLTEDDADNLFTLHNDPDVMRFLNGGKPTPRDEILDQTLPRIFGFYERFEGFGYWAAIEKSTEDFLGWFLFRPAESGPADDIELGYRLHKAVWGKGYATEGSKALIRKGFSELGVRRVFATTMAVNTGSRRVMEKAGLSYVRTFHEQREDPIDGAEHGEVEYALHRSGWLASG